MVEKGKAGRKRWKRQKRKLAGVKKGNERRVEAQQRGRSTRGSKAGEDNETKRYGSKEEKGGEDIKIRGEDVTISIIFDGLVIILEIFLFSFITNKWKIIDMEYIV